jgi:hypothetical protein
MLGARWLDPELGRFISPDSIVPEANDPQALNRYAYARNSPLTYVDTSGHCWGFASGIRGLPSYGTTCSNLDMALTIVQNPNTSLGDKALAGGYIALEGTAHVAVAVGAAGIVCGLAAPCAAAVEPALGIGTTATTAACADGDCGNEASAAGRTVQTVTDAASRARVTYDGSLLAGEGTTDKLGNIRISPLGSALDRAQALYHEEVHSFFTPRGSLQELRANISMGAYNNSHLLRYAEEAIAETRAQLMTGGSLQAGLMFPLNGGYNIQPWRMALEGGALVGGTYWIGNRIAGVLAK